MSHTPGPWTIDPNEDYPLAVIRVDEDNDGIGVCEIGTEYQPTRADATPEQFANARLIAAAPEMLEALERVSNAFQRGRYPELQGVACDVFEAIRKAKGE